MSERPDLGALFGPGGALARVTGQFEFRAGQRKMAEAVARAFAERRQLVVEAATGTGKTLAYLVPALLADEQVILSTGTKTLQEQIVARELPLAAAAAGVSRDVVVLKGRENYLCRKRLAEFEAEPLLESLAEAPLWEKIVPWARRTTTGDRAEAPGLPDVSPLWNKLDGRADICTGQKCEFYERCFVVLARRRAAQAQVVVVNHHLLFADLALKASGQGRILPDASLLVLDEAHLVEDAAVSHFGTKLSSRMLADLARDVEEELARVGADPLAAKRLARAGKAFFKALRPRAEGRVAFRSAAFAESSGTLADALVAALDDAAAAVGGPGERTEERILLAGRCAAQRDALSELVGDQPLGRVATAEQQGKDGAVLAAWPVDISSLLEQTFAAAFTAVVATSATLSVAGSLERARFKLGLPAADALLVRSPFDHARQAALYVPREFPEPGHPAFPERCLREIEELLRITEGRALVLFASHRALRRAADQLTSVLPWPVLVQGDAPRERLIEEFRREVHSVLLGAASFRQGIDVPGEALSLVIVDKLPFAVPDDPLVVARAEMIRGRGGDPFDEDQLPEAILALKQGLGRLIRHRTDTGLLALLDVRVRTRRYGATVFASLPPWPVLDDLEQARDWRRRNIPR